MKKLVFAWMVAAMAVGAAGCAKKELVGQVTEPQQVTQGREASGNAETGGKETRQGLSQEGVTGEAAGQERREAEREDSITAAIPAPLVPVYFDFDSWVLSPRERERLSMNAKWLEANPLVKVVLEGHTDERGSDQYNLALGEKRARAVKDLLVTFGIPSDRLSLMSYGEETPAAQGSGENAWSLNRRVEFRTEK